MKSIIGFSFIVFLIVFSACKKEEQQVVYNVNPEKVYQNAAEKRSLKSETEFISIAYSDLFGNAISYNELQKIQAPYLSFGDKSLIVDLIIRNFLSKPNVAIPTDVVMRSNVAEFVSDAYLKIYNRKPNEFEQWKMEQLINTDNEITAELIYYALLTSTEYRYY